MEEVQNELIEVSFKDIKFQIVKRGDDYFAYMGDLRFALFMTGKDCLSFTSINDDNLKKFMIKNKIIINNNARIVNVRDVLNWLIEHQPKHVNMKRVEYLYNLTSPAETIDLTKEKEEEEHINLTKTVQELDEQIEEKVARYRKRLYEIAGQMVTAELSKKIKK